MATTRRLMEKAIYYLHSDVSDSQVYLLFREDGYVLSSLNIKKVAMPPLFSYEVRHAIKSIGNCVLRYRIRNENLKKYHQ